MCIYKNGKGRKFLDLKYIFMHLNLADEQYEINKVSLYLKFTDRDICKVMCVLHRIIYLPVCNKLGLFN